MNVYFPVMTIKTYKVSNGIQDIGGMREQYPAHDFIGGLPVVVVGVVVGGWFPYFYFYWGDEGLWKGVVGKMVYFLPDFM